VTSSDRGRILIIVQNLPVPFDRRVWLECRTLTEAGYDVAVVCPKGPDDPAYEVLSDVELFKYRPFTSTGGAASFFLEYLYSFAATLWLTAKASRGRPFAAIQSCNPPDIFWPIGVLFRTVHGSRFVFDHHDLCPETYQSRFPDGSRVLQRALRFLERRTVRNADHVISTNDSYQEVVRRRHRLPIARSSVVRTGPDPDRLKPRRPDPELRRNRPHLVAYLGVMGPQDGVDIVLQMADLIVNRLHREDISFTLIGSGDCFNDLVAMRDQLGLRDFVEFTGRVPDDTVAAILSSADAGISPDPKNPLNDLSTMNKTMEYMAFGLPVVAFDLRETRVSAAEAGVYAKPNDVNELARALLDLLDDGPRRQSMGAAGRTRVERDLAWSHQAPKYLGVYERILPSPPHARSRQPVAP
jgi:glycosyltransferase involved in cell wall biosynthesis